PFVRAGPFARERTEQLSQLRCEIVGSLCDDRSPERQILARAAGRRRIDRQVVGQTGREVNEVALTQGGRLLQHSLDSSPDLVLRAPPEHEELALLLRYQQ